MSKPLDFQSIILTLDHFWAEHGCLIWHPYYQQVGAGTYNPATFLRVLGPEPWNVGYLEPSIRPDDGRYGDNPNRLQQFYQYQVILKPDPGNPQELYLASLKALGIDPRQHDIRFVEDNWESPALGAWGLGWEVWLDGQEITQYTYFQQAGGFMLNPVSVELTYGLERIAMVAQKVRNFRDIRWSIDRTDGDVNLQGEREHSTYYYDVANVDRVHQMYTLYDAEANLALEKGLVLPAHDYVLKLSHAFNILDARGAVGVTERQAMFAKMRDLSHRVAEAYLAQREALGYPWLKEKSSSTKVVPETKKIKSSTVHFSAPQDFLFEIGTEELPVSDLESALEQLKSRVPAMLDDLRLEHGSIKVMGTPRRLVVMTEKLAAHQHDREVVVKGPPANRAFDEKGNPTPAGAGFARSKGLDPTKLETRDMDGGTYAAAVVKEPGRPTLDMLGEALPNLIAGLKFDKSMRWNESQVAFSRPIRWLLALFGKAFIPFEYAGVKSGNTTRGLRFYEPGTFTVEDIASYVKALQSHGIICDPGERKAFIASQMKKVAEKAGAVVTPDDSLLDENTNLVEAPTAMLGNFDPASLKLPADVLVSVMKKHQRYFPVQEKNGKLMPHFVIVRNGDGQHADLVADGNEQVIMARFADAEFFIREDLKHKLQDLLPRLGTLTFQKKLGSMLDKTHRIEKLVDALLKDLVLPKDEEQITRRAAALCKADLVSKMVVEMTSLQGVMGEYYALQSAELPAVAGAIREHYLPRFAGDAVPSSLPACLISIADRLDSLAGLFAAGLAPTGTKDPFALRRAALGLVQLLIEKDMKFDLGGGLQLAAANLPLPASAEQMLACREFITGRLQSFLLDKGFKYDVVAAVLAEQSSNPSGAFHAVQELTEWVQKPEWKTILPAYARCVRITRDQKEVFPVKENLLKEKEERNLFKDIQMMEVSLELPGSIDKFVQAFTPNIQEVNTYFDKVLVMDDDPTIRANRIGTLQRLANLGKGTADFSLLEGF